MHPWVQITSGRFCAGMRICMQMRGLSLDVACIMQSSLSIGSELRQAVQLLQNIWLDVRLLLQDRKRLCWCVMLLDAAMVLRLYAAFCATRTSSRRDSQLARGCSRKR